MVLGIVPLVGAGGDEQLRHLVFVQITLDRGIGRRAERVEQQQHLLLLDQLAHHLDGLRRAIAVVATDEVDLAAVDAALVVDHGEVGGLRLADGAVGRSRAAIGHGVADLDLGVADAGTVLAGGKSQSACEREAKCCQPRHHGLFHCHDVLPLRFSLLRMRLARRLPQRPANRPPTAGWRRRPSSLAPMLQRAAARVVRPRLNRPEITGPGRCLPTA